MLTRRDTLRVGGLVAAGLAAPALTACAAAASAHLPPGSDTVIEADVARSVPLTSALAPAAAAVRSFTADLYRRLATGAGNVVCSPYSVAVALAMTRNGARGRTASEMDAVLHSPGLAELNAGLNALAQLMDSRSGRRRNETGTKTRMTLDLANSLWGQRGETFGRPFLRTLAADYGTGMHTVDYATAADTARTAINDWTSSTTDGRIPDLVPAGVLDDLTRLVLVNAIYLRAPWWSSFDRASTGPQDFHRADGSRVRVPMMHSDAILTSGAGPGWRAVDIPYAGAELAMAVVLPDGGPLSALEARLDGPGLNRLLTGFGPDEVHLAMPTWTSRTTASLVDTLSALGMPTAFSSTRADLSGITAQDRLFVSAVLHQAWIAVDEQGTEAAAATAVVAEASSGLVARPVTMTLDRPFLYVIHDIATATPLFIGRVSDPSVGAT